MTLRDVLTMSEAEALERNPFCTCETGSAKRRAWQFRYDRWLAFVAETKAKQAEAKKRHDEVVFRASGMPLRYREFTLKSFAALIGNKDKGKTTAIIAAKRMMETGVIERADGLLKRSLFLWGERGIGKTGLLAPVFTAFEAQGKDCLWLSFLELMSQIRSGYDTGDAYARLERAKRADVLMIDDLGQTGRDEETVHTRAIMQEVIYRRHGDDMTTLITSNQDPSQLAGQFSIEFYQRIAEMAMVTEMTGKVLRVLE